MKPYSFSKFFELRPGNIKLMGPKGTHSVCVCVYHQNVFLMLSAIKAEKHTKHMFMDSAVCSIDNPYCMYGNCSSCPGIEPVKSLIRQFVGDKAQVIVVWVVWETVDRSMLRVFEKDSEEFVEFCAQKIIKCLTHHFFKKKTEQIFEEFERKFEGG